jgi:hypothetical protein
VSKWAGAAVAAGAVAGAAYGLHNRKKKADAVTQHEKLTSQDMED